MPQEVKGNENVYVKSFPGVKTVYMEGNYIRPLLRIKSEVILLHVGKNNVRTEDKTEDIANDIIH